MAKLNVIWPQFAVCNDNATREFEEMCRRIFRMDLAGGQLLCELPKKSTLNK